MPEAAICRTCARSSASATGHTNARAIRRPGPQSAHCIVQDRDPLAEAAILHGLLNKLEIFGPISAAHAKDAAGKLISLNACPAQRLINGLPDGLEGSLRRYGIN